MEETNRKSIFTKRWLYAAAAILAPVSGAAVGIFGSMLFTVSSLTDTRSLTPEELEESAKFNSEWMATFAGDKARADLLNTFVWIIVISAIVFLASLAVMCIMTGRMDRNEDGSIRMNWFDRFWSEVHLAAGATAGGLAIYMAVPAMHIIRQADWFTAFKPFEQDAYVYGIENTSAMILIAAGMAALIEIAVLCFVSLVKKLKAKEFLTRSILGKLIIALWHAVKAAWKFFTDAIRGISVPGDADSKATIKLMAKYILLAGVLIFGPVLLVAFFNSLEIYVAGLIISFAAATFVIIRKIGKLAEIRSGVIEVKSGNLTHKIPVNMDEKGFKTDLDKLASDINHISEATNVAVQNEIKNQRLKTDLISNVSHDLKTPLTSMISYLDILEKEGLDSPDAPAHLAVVKEKTERLRTLTEELFEAAKASSGNIPCEMTDINLASLIDQSLAEMGDRLDSKDLIVRKSIKAENTMVRADGKLLYRVLENLLSNISKYALEGSRVYIDVSERGDRLFLEVKNISRDELNISAEELMERFTRGDQSRNTEGSGLGLAIAKDLTTLMGGIFEISIDGDMFKASVLLNRA